MHADLVGTSDAGMESLYIDIREVLGTGHSQITYFVRSPPPTTLPGSCVNRFGEDVFIRFQVHSSASLCAMDDFETRCSSDFLTRPWYRISPMLVTSNHGGVPVLLTTWGPLPCCPTLRPGTEHFAHTVGPTDRGTECSMTTHPPVESGALYYRYI
ncbi:hypothetical protein BDN67DRAFT_697617 [Paxillus ammoniavirescens]|nr:hypothetical protein BDN67DRAFT_697617 [Paxillus ammoniavirescens]